jgi:hypothetical protein
MRRTASSRFGGQCLINGAEMSRPDMVRVQSKVAQRVRFIEQELCQTPVSFPHIAWTTRGHHVPARRITTAHLRLHVIECESARVMLHPAVHAAPLIASEHVVAFHNG